MYGLTIGWGANIVHDTIGMMVWCNYVLDSLGNNNFCIARPETLPRHLGWTNTHLGHPERPIPFWEINSTLHLSIQISMYPPPTTVPCWQCRCHIPVWDPTKLWPFRSNSREWPMLIPHALQTSSHRECNSQGRPLLKKKKQCFQFSFHRAYQDILNCGTFHVDGYIEWGGLFGFVYGSIK